MYDGPRTRVKLEIIVDHRRMWVDEQLRWTCWYVVSPEYLFVSSQTPTDGVRHDIHARLNQTRPATIFLRFRFDVGSSHRQKTDAF